MYFFIHHDVIFHKRHFFPVGMQETLQQRRRFQRTAEIDALRSIHQFDGKDMFKVVHHFIKFGCGIGPHTYVVFLPVGRNDGIARCGIAVHFILTDHRRSSVLGNHKAGIQSRIGYQKFRKFAKSHNQLRDTAFGDISQFCQGNGEKVIGDSQRLTVEISTGNDSVFVREDRWIVRDGIDFGQQYGGNVTDGIFGMLWREEPQDSEY